MKRKLCVATSKIFLSAPVTAAGLYTMAATMGTVTNVMMVETIIPLAQTLPSIPTLSAAMTAIFPTGIASICLLYTSRCV